MPTKTEKKPGPRPIHGEAMTGAERQAELRKRRSDLEYRTAVTLLRLSRAAPEVDVPDDVSEWAQRLVDRQKAAWQAEAIKRARGTGGPVPETLAKHPTKRAARG